MSDLTVPQPAAIWIAGSTCLVVAREWRHDDFTALTAEQIYLRVDGYDTLQEAVDNIGLRFPETTSEALAEGLASGTLKRIELPEALPG
jgi:hypothetical protein